MFFTNVTIELHSQHQFPGAFSWLVTAVIVLVKSSSSSHVATTIVGSTTQALFAVIVIVAIPLAYPTGTLGCAARVSALACDILFEAAVVS